MKESSLEINSSAVERVDLNGPLEDSKPNSQKASVTKYLLAKFW